MWQSWINKEIGEKKKKKSPYSAMELKIFSSLHLPVVDRICHGKMSDFGPTQPHMPDF